VQKQIFETHNVYDPILCSCKTASKRGIIRSLVTPDIKFIVKNNLTDARAIPRDLRVLYSLLARVFKACYVLIV